MQEEGAWGGCREVDAEGGPMGGLMAPLIRTRVLFYEIARSWGESTHSVQGTSDESTSSGRPSSTWIASMLRVILSFSIRSILFFSFTLFFDAWFGFDIDQLDKKSPDFDVVLHRCVVRQDDSACSTE